MSGAGMRTREPRHGAGTSEEEEAEIDQMERGELSGWDVVVAAELGEVRGRDWVFTAAWERATHAVVEAGARALFYPTLLRNVALNWLKPDFEWWDRVDEYVLLGAVPFLSDVTRLKELGVRAVVTLTRSYETLVPSSVYQAHQLEHLEIPTTDIVFAPSMVNIQEAVDFIHHHALQGGSTYVHCKAGICMEDKQTGLRYVCSFFQIMRCKVVALMCTVSTTIVLCYLVRQSDL